jgi:hypothetical protein
MKYRAVIKKSDEWWIGWLIDLPGVNAQEKTREELLESLRIGATKGQSPEFFTGCLSLETIWNKLENPQETTYYIAGPPR